MCVFCLFDLFKCFVDFMFAVYNVSTLIFDTHTQKKMKTLFVEKLKTRIKKQLNIPNAVCYNNRGHNIPLL